MLMFKKYEFLGITKFNPYFHALTSGEQHSRLYLNLSDLTFEHDFMRIGFRKDEPFLTSQYIISSSPL